jgi:hypothetical protein
LIPANGRRRKKEKAAEAAPLIEAALCLVHAEFLGQFLRRHITADNLAAGCD